ncbi:uncharacterized protein K02A2.6-like [Anastrepha ludens]|uniref:uncharacterized protein K02A2.6-like n=1 Tax=Anastrepha ludens TaxID=28586 RepID=UPI0023AFD4DD|nr:uncharacterized protein K02A2.6-like [Anastrepha ludens]
MLALDIIEPVSGPTSWISPIVIVFKEGGEMRLCIDMRRANQAVLRENYPLPTFEVFMTKLRGAKFFSRIDLKWAYHQLELHKSSRHITTFISHKGVFQYKRLMFGINSAPEIFQRVIEKLLCSCKNALNYIDDIIIFGRTELEHDEAVKKVVDVFKNNNLLLNEAKCVWKVRQLKFLGHLISDGGIAPDPSKVQTIRDFRAPQSKEELRSFLGLVTYVGKFIPDLASTTESLRCLLKLNCKFTWGEPQKDAFNKLKLALSEIPKLAYFDPNKKTRVIADASPVALGAVLLQTDLAGEAQVISFASKSLSDTEKRYSQTEKESLALVWAVERYYYYLMGLEFELVTDHKPLETIFKPTSKPPARIERWLLRLQPFKFKVIYRPGKENIADSVSRLCKVVNASTFDNDHNHNIFHIVESSIPSAMGICEIAKESTKDQELVNAASYVKDGLWETDKTSTFYPFRYELSAVGDILLRGTRIVIPKTLREQTLQLAHEGHPGESAMKRRLRSKVWWPLIDRDAESFVKRCVDCLLVSQPNKPAPMQRHSFPNGPWQCVATDLLGPLPNDEYVLVLIDYYSRYQEVKFTKRITSEVIISILREIFSRLGIPNSLRADNGRQFVSAEFKSFCQTHNMELITTPPYWPQANGEVENMNRSLVKRLIIAHNNKRDYKKEIQDFTLMYNVTPHGTTGTSPSELLFNRVIRDKIPGIQDLTGDMLDSAARDLDMINKWKGKEKADTKRGVKEPDIEVGDKVLLRNVIFPHKLTPTFDPTEYVVKEVNGNEVTIAANGKSLRRNISHVKRLPVTKNANPSVSGEHQNAAGLTTPVTTTTTVPAKVASDMVPQSEASSARPHKAVTVSSSTIPTASNS